jgi:hypothetical protein
MAMEAGESIGKMRSEKPSKDEMQINVETQIAA